MSIGGIIIDYIDHQLKMGRDTVSISSHNFDDVKLHGLDKFNKLHNSSSYEREWRRLRQKKLIKGVSITAISNNSRETTWNIKALQI